MKNNKGNNDQEDSKDRIEGDTIILHDDHKPGPRTLKRVEIIISNGKKRFYEIRKTSKCGYLFN